MLQGEQLVHHTLETLKGRVSGPFVNLKEAEQSMDFLCTGSREHIGHVSCFREIHQDKLPGHSRITSLIRLFAPSSASALCHSLLLSVCNLLSLSTYSVTAYQDVRKFLAVITQPILIFTSLCVSRDSRKFSMSEKTESKAYPTPPETSSSLLLLTCEPGIT